MVSKTTITYKQFSSILQLMMFILSVWHYVQDNLSKNISSQRIRIHLNSELQINVVIGQLGWRFDSFSQCAQDVWMSQLHGSLLSFSMQSSSPNFFIDDYTRHVFCISIILSIASVLVGILTARCYSLVHVAASCISLCTIPREYWPRFITITTINLLFFHTFSSIDPLALSHQLACINHRSGSGTLTATLTVTQH